VSRGVSRIVLDGDSLPPDAPIALLDDGATHRVQVILGS
jgi:hypothetical protein